LFSRVVSGRAHGIGHVAGNHELVLIRLHGSHGARTHAGFKLTVTNSFTRKSVNIWKMMVRESPPTFVIPE
jgi:hypothetical protein